METFFWKLIFNEIFKLFIENELISPNQSEFKPDDSGINQLLAIAHEIFKLFDEEFEVKCFSRYIEDVWQSLAWVSHF